MTNRERLIAHIREHGPVPTVRVSSAQARGAAKAYPYWGSVRYEVRLTRDGRLTHKALECANSDRRSEKLAIDDAQRIADEEGRVLLESPPGGLTDTEVETVLEAVGVLDIS